MRSRSSAKAARSSVIEETIGERIKAKIEEADDKSTGNIADLTV
jgi:hypothetical protein